METRSTPVPIAVIVEKMRQAREPIARFIQVGNLFEVTLRYLATLALGSLFQVRRQRSVHVPTRLLTGLRRPSIGHWCQVLQSVPPRLAASGPLPIPELMSLTEPRVQPDALLRAVQDLQTFLGKRDEGPPRRISLAAILDLLVVFRNKTKAHGAIQDDLVAHLNPVLENAMESLLGELAWLGAYSLVVRPESSPAANTHVPVDANTCPPSGRPGVLDRRGIDVIDLHPAAIWHDGDCWFLNGWDNNEQIEYLSYATGRTCHRADRDIETALTVEASAPGDKPATSPRLSITVAHPWDHPVDVAVMAQDRHRVFGPVTDIDLSIEAKPRLQRALAQIDQAGPAEALGDVLVSRRPWCAARFLIEAIVYDLDQPVPTDPAIVGRALDGALSQIADLGAGTIVMSPLGSEYGNITCAEFVAQLGLAWQRHSRRLGAVDQIMFAVREPAQAEPLRDALQQRFGHGVTIGT